MITQQTSIADTLKAVFISMDSTLRSNLSVGLPLDLVVLPAGQLSFSAKRRVEATDEDWKDISASWSLALSSGFGTLPPVAIPAPD
jgi:putative proteasome-type protease